MYVGFIMTGNYMIITYCFHKFESFSLFFAYSITIYDWSTLLHEINEDTLFRYLARGATLIIINVVYFTICSLQVFSLFSTKSIASYVLSAIYDIGIYAQILASLSITTIFLSAGLKLWYRIKGVAGNDSGNDSSMTINISPFKRRSQTQIQTNNSSVEFRNALFNLILVMSTCSTCILIQILLLILNQAFGYATSPDKYIVGWAFFWTFYAWIPLWGPVISLLYLSRSSSTTTSSNYQSLPIDDSSEHNSIISYPKKISITSKEDIETPLISVDNDYPGVPNSGSPNFLVLPGMEAYFNNTTYSPDSSLNSIDHSEMSYRDIKAAAATTRRY